MILKELCKKLNDFADEKYYKKDFDKVGLFVGDMSNDIKKVLTATDVTLENIDFAAKNGYDMILCHHPLFFDGLPTVTEENLIQKKVRRLIKEDIAVFSMHTNLDSVPGGLNDIFCEILGLENCSPIEQTKIPNYLFMGSIPPKYKDEVLNKIFSLGVGCKNNYKNVNFEEKITFRYTPTEGSDPFIGSENTESIVSEQFFCILVSQNLLEKVKNTYIEAHPYEIPVYHIVETPQYDYVPSLGRVGYLPYEMTCDEFEEYCKKAFMIKSAKSYPLADRSKKIRKVGLCSGSGGSLFEKACSLGCDAYVCGDIKHSMFLEGADRGIFLLDLGHYETECTSAYVLENYIKQIDGTIEVLNFEAHKGNRLVKKLIAEGIK